MQDEIGIEIRKITRPWNIIKTSMMSLYDESSLDILFALDIIQDDIAASCRQPPWQQAKEND